MRRSFGAACRRLLHAAPILLGTGSAFAASLPAPSPEEVSRGAYLAAAGDCAACHTTQHGAALAGGLAIATPIGTIYSSNITPDPKTGIGSWSYDAFAKLMRRGIRPDGSPVYPAMPFPSYARIDDRDMHALYAYFMHGVTPVAAPDRKSDIPWPLSMRWPLHFWNALFAPTPSTVPAASGSPPNVARGAYLVEGLEHCGACHTPRAITMNEKALTAADGAAYLAGGQVVDGWLAPGLHAGGRDGLQDWSVDEIAQFLKTGRNRHGSSFGGMTTVVVDSTQYLSNDDLTSIALYLKSLPATSGTASGSPASHTAQMLRSGQNLPRGAQIYVDRCAACHRTDGAGYPGVLPPLAGNPVLQAENGTSAVHIILSGARLPGVATAPSPLVMGAYEHILSDQDVADVASFIQSAWGNRGGSVSTALVAKLRTSVQADSADLTPSYEPAVKHDRP